MKQDPWWKRNFKWISLALIASGTTVAWWWQGQQKVGNKTADKTPTRYLAPISYEVSELEDWREDIKAILREVKMAPLRSTTLWVHTEEQAAFATEQRDLMGMTVGKVMVGTRPFGKLSTQHE